MKTLTLGPATIDRVTERAHWSFDADELFPEITVQQLQQAGPLGPNFINPRTRKVVLSLHSYLVRTPTTTILVDSGNGNHKERPALPAHHRFTTDYLDVLATSGVQPSDVDIVIATHLHPDHCGWNTRLSGQRWVPTFPNARYFFGRREFEAFETLHRAQPEDPVSADLARTFDDSVLPVVRAGQAVIVDTPHTAERKRVRHHAA